MPGAIVSAAWTLIWGLTVVVKDKKRFHFRSQGHLDRDNYTIHQWLDILGGNASTSTISCHTDKGRSGGFGTGSGIQPDLA